MTQHLPTFINAVAPIIDHYGYWAVFGLIFLEDFGLFFIPGETTLIAASIFAGLGHLNIFVVAILAFLGAVLGDNVGFAIGEYGGHPLIDKYGKYILLTHKRVEKAVGFFNRYGGRVVAIARFVDVLRQANGIIAGMSEMRWKKFLAFNALGAALWVGAWVNIGYFAGEHVQIFLKYELYFSIAVFVIIAGVIFNKLVIKKRKESKTEKI